MSTSRTTLMLAVALAHLGVEDPRQHILVAVSNGADGRLVSNIIVSMTPLRLRDVASFQRRCGLLKLDIALSPRRTQRARLPGLVSMETRSASLRDHPLDLSMSTDKRPYLRFQSRVGDSINPTVSKVLRGDAGQALGFAFWACLLGMVMAMVPSMMNFWRRREGASFILLTSTGVGLGISVALVAVVVFSEAHMQLDSLTDSLFVGLSGFLVSLALGAIANRWLHRSQGWLSLLFSCGIVLLYLWVRWQWFAAFDHQPWVIRAVSVVALAAPVGFVLGLSLPFAFRALSPEEIPGQWAIHVTSWVFGACAATFLSVHWGFDIPLIIAACVCGALFALHVMALGLQRLG